MNEVIAATPIRQLLDQAHSGVVVLERIARGGGSTKWFYVESSRELDALLPLLRPGSLVSFYFDSRVRYERISPAFTDEVLSIVTETGDAVVGLLGPDSLAIDMESVAGPNDLAEFTETLGAGSRVFLGAFPAPDNDGYRAVTVVLPDLDGVVREHPH